MPRFFDCPDFLIAQIFSGFSGIKIGRHILWLSEKWHSRVSENKITAQQGKRK